MSTPSSVNGETELNAYMRVQEEANDTDPLMWWNQYQQEFPHLTHMVRQYLTVTVTSVSPERLFSTVGLVKSDFQGNLLDTTLIDVMWVKQAPGPELNLKEMNRNDTLTLTHRDIHSLTIESVTHTFPKLTDYQ